MDSQESKEFLLSRLYFCCNPCATIFRRVFYYFVHVCFSVYVLLNSICLGIHLILFYFIIYIFFWYIFYQFINFCIFDLLLFCV